MGWILDGHEPLRHRIVRLTDAADFAVGPRLHRYPFNRIVEVALLDLVEEMVFAYGPPGAGDIHVQEGIAVVDIPADRSRLAPQIHRISRRVVIVEAIGRCREERRIAPRLFWKEQGGIQNRTVAHRDGDYLCRLDQFVIRRVRMSHQRFTYSYGGCSAERAKKTRGVFSVVLTSLIWRQYPHPEDGRLLVQTKRTWHLVDHRRETPQV